MDREDLVDVLAAMKDDTLVVMPNGVLYDLDRDAKFSPDDVAEAAAELTADLNKLIAWAELAPKYQEPQQ